MTAFSLARPKLTVNQVSTGRNQDHVFSQSDPVLLSGPMAVMKTCEPLIILPICGTMRVAFS